MSNRENLAVLLAVVTILTTLYLPAFAVEAEPSESEGPIISSAERRIPAPISTTALLTEEELRNIYWNSDQFQAHYADDPADAIAMLEHHVAEYFRGCPVGTRASTNEDVASVNTTFIKQTNNHTCGPPVHIWLLVAGMEQEV